MGHAASCKAATVISQAVKLVQRLATVLAFQDWLPFASGKRTQQVACTEY
jgi:hypothetical protein